MAEYSEEERSFLDSMPNSYTSRAQDEDGNNLTKEEDNYDSRQRRGAGLEDDGVFEIATELHGVSSGEIESVDRRRTRESLEAMASGQRGRGQSGTGLRSAARLRGGETNAQAVELIGGQKLSESSEMERGAAKGQLRDLMIQGRTRAENKELRMQEIAFQREQANKGFWGDVLSGVLGAVGGAVGFFAAGPGGAAAGAAAGASILGGVGKATGRTFG
tara:strand:+ start:12796 stop:13449 length:654 start_codon:yes stop_codon:yes gene_type:complete